MNKEIKELIEGNEGVKFDLKECHIHFECGCCQRAGLCLLNSRVSITVLAHCPTHKGKKPAELMIGLNCMTDITCDTPGCDCDSVSIIMPLKKFQYLLKHEAKDNK